MGLLASKPVVKAGRDSTPWCSANTSCQMIMLVVGGSLLLRHLPSLTFASTQLGHLGKV